jgi:hypothetical protein
MRVYSLIKLVILTVLITSCKSNNESELKQNLTSETDSITDEFDFSKYNDYKIESHTNEYGKVERIDSLFYNIMRRYYVEDSTKIRYEHYSDFVNDTAVYKEYYKNGNLKEITRETLRHSIAIKQWYYYNPDGSINKIIDYSEDSLTSFEEAIEIAILHKVKRPFAFQLFDDNLSWIVANWEDTTSDTMIYGGIETGKGIIIDRKNNQVKTFEHSVIYEN